MTGLNTVVDVGEEKISELACVSEEVTQNLRTER